MGVRQIVALRGDPEGGAEADYVPHPHGYAYASDLVQGYLRSIHLNYLLRPTQKHILKQFLEMQTWRI